MTQQTIVAVTATVLAARLLFNYWRSSDQPLAQPQEKEGQKTPEKNRTKQDSEVLEEAVSEKLEERSPQEMKNCGPVEKGIGCCTNKSR